MQFHELAPEQQSKIKGDHPEFESYAPGRQAAVIKDRLKKDSRNTKALAGKAEETKSKLSIDATPTGYHKALYTGMEAIENAANDHPNQRAMQPVFNYLENARASLREHWNLHHEGKVEEAAGHARNAADAIGSAVRAFHVLSPLPGGPEPIAEHVKTIADGYKFNVANGRARNVKHAAYDNSLGNKADASLDEQTKREKKAGKAWDAYVKNADKKLPPKVVRQTPQEEQESRAKSLDITRSAREAEPKGTIRSFSELAPEEKAQRTREAAKRVISRATTAPTPEYVSGAQKYTGTLGQYGKNSRVGVPSENRGEYLDHAVIARKALLQGKPIPSETKVALGAFGLEAVHRSHNEAVFGTSSSTVEPSGEDVPRTRGGRGGSLEEFATGKA